MIEIVIMILVGKQFHQLAKKYNQKIPWVYAIVGIVSYYGGAFVTGVLLGIYMELTGHYILDDVNELLLGLIFIPFGALICWGVYQLLSRKWRKDFLEEERKKPKISDIGKSEEDTKPTEDFLIGNRDLGDLGKKKDDGFRF
ncbi:hypothetical protein [Kordia sp.]|uniref:hypothetical protein n=1 Tax=Kordia sp. TaxID=1965332 RepID=UPI003B5B49DA